MYYVFKNDMVIWKSNLLHAKITSKINLQEYGSHWWKGKSLERPLPLLRFSVNEKAPLLDNYFTGMSLDLYSERFINVLSETNIKFEWFPAELINNTNKKIVSKQYKIFHLLEIANGVNLKKSKFNDETIEKLVLRDDVINNGKPIFRLAEFTHIVLVRSDLKDRLDELLISGCKYIPIDEYRIA